MVVNNLYQAKTDDVAASMEFSDDFIAQVLHDIYRRGKALSPADLSPELFRAILRRFNEATAQGMAAADVPDLDDDFRQALRHSNEVFSAFKVHRMQSDMARLLTDSNGDLKPFNQWANDVLPIASHQCGAWLRTEYDTAVIRAHQAADWQQFLREADVLPNLKWMPSTSPNPGADHQVFWNTVRPISDPFWNEHRPGDRWNCKCSLSSTDEPCTAAPMGDKHSTPQPGLDSNPGTDKAVFSQSHPYFPKSCSSCCFYKPGFKDTLRSFFTNRTKDCYNCPYMNGCLDKMKRSQIKPPKVEEYKVEHNGHVFISPYHGANEVEDNKRLAAFIADKLKTNVYLLPRLDPSNPKENILRPILHPPGVFDKKNPDFLINGKLFDGKCMYDLDKTANLKQQKNAIENHIKKAKKQADNIILEMPSFMDRKNAENTIRNYLNRSKTKRVIMVRYCNKLLIFKN